MAKCPTGCANKWEWVSVNGSWTGLVGRRHEKSVGHSKLRLYMFNFFSFFFFFFNCCTIPNNDTSIWWRRPLYRGRIPGELEVKVCEKMKPGTHWHSVLCNKILISYVAEPEFRFRCNERGVHTGVGWWLGWRSVIWSVSNRRGCEWKILIP